MAALRWHFGRERRVTMKFPLKTAVAVVVLGAVGAAYPPLRTYWNERHRPRYRLAEVTRGPIVAVVNSTGTVQPEVSVSVGSFVSGPIEQVYVDFNAVVKKGDLLAKIDPRLYEANVARDEAVLATRKAERDRVAALLQQAANDLSRAEGLHKQNLISDTEIDQFRFNHLSLKAQLAVAETSIDTALAGLENSLANLEYTEIRSPVDGVVINRKIDQGQTVAAQFQTPELFVVSPDLRTKMRVLASVDEADIGLVREAERRKLPVRFTVDAYPDDLFEATIFQIRMSSTTTQNVVTYPVVATAPNPDLKLFPGMTASLSFQVDEIESALRVPNAALRFYPPLEQVRPADRNLLEGAELAPQDEEYGAGAKRSAAEKADVRRRRHRRHVWVTDGAYLKAVEVITGISDHRYTQLISGELTEGQQLVTGIQPPS
jgi:HlyD family secretion protein